jgi:hypothetical protein
MTAENRVSFVRNKNQLKELCKLSYRPSNFENALESEDAFRAVKNCEISLFLLEIMISFLSILSFEIQKKPEADMDIIGNYSLVINLMLMLIKIPMIFIKNYLALKFSKVKHLENIHTKMSESKLYSLLVFELVINLFTPTKIFDFTFFNIRYSFNSTYTDTEEDPSTPKLKQ